MIQLCQLVQEEPLGERNHLLQSMVVSRRSNGKVGAMRYVKADAGVTDQTINAAFRRLKHFHPEYAKKYVDKRFQIIK